MLVLTTGHKGRGGGGGGGRGVMDARASLMSC